MRVSEYAKIIAYQFSYDEHKASIAGLLHDCAKEMSNEELISMCKKHKLPIGEKDIEDAHHLHGVVGACIARDIYNVKDDEILLAIANHSGRPDMTPTEKIVMLADLFDSFEKKKIDISYAENCKDLDHALLMVLGPTLQYCVENNIYLAERTQDSFDYILTHKLKDKYADKNFIFDVEILSDDGATNIKYSNIELEEQMFENAIKLNKEHGIKLSSVGNIRDLGGYVTRTGRTLRKHKIIRSASLSNLSKQDSQFLKNYGITTIIDLRSLDEIKQAPDINIEGFKYINCPLPISNPELGNFRDRMIERKGQAFTTSEDIWYNVQYFASFDMIDMYKQIFFDEKCHEQIRKIFSIINQNEGGVLYHCTSGKDRTGIITILLLFFLDVNIKDIREDYYTSSLYGLANTQSFIVDMILDGFGRKIISETQRVMGISVDSLPKIWNIIIQKFGSFENYINNEINISTEDIKNLNKKLCE